MEQWEKEYLKIIQQRNRVHRRKPAKLRINKRWEEVTRPDGSKWYIPKQKAFRKQEQKQRRQSRISTETRKFGKVILIVALVVALIYALPSLMALKPNPSTDLPSSSNVLHVHNTYVNGLGLKNMADTLWAIREKQTTTLNTYVAGGRAFSEEEMNAWKDSLGQDLVTIKNLHYDSSYSNLIEGYVTLLNILQDYIDYEMIGNRKMAVATHSKYSSLLSELPYIFAEALESNGVKYTLDETGLMFTYYKY